MSSYNKLSDEEVVKLIQNSDKELYSEIIHRYQSKLTRYLRSILRDDSQVSDALQESFIKAYINLNSFQLDKKFSSWMYRIVHNEAINIVLKSKNQRQFEENEEFDSGIDIEDEFIRNELVNETHICLDTMDIVYRIPLSLYFLEDKSYDEISYILRIPVSTVGTRIKRAKSLLKKICQNQKKYHR